MCVCVYESCKMILGKKSNKRRLGFFYFTILARLVDKQGHPLCTRNQQGMRWEACVLVGMMRKAKNRNNNCNITSSSSSSSSSPPPLLSSLCCNFTVTISRAYSLKCRRRGGAQCAVALGVALRKPLPTSLSLSLSLSFLPLLLQANSNPECGR